MYFGKVEMHLGNGKCIVLQWRRKGWSRGWSPPIILGYKLTKWFLTWALLNHKETCPWSHPTETSFYITVLFTCLNYPQDKSMNSSCPVIWNGILARILLWLALAPASSPVVSHLAMIIFHYTLWDIHNFYTIRCSSSDHWPSQVGPFTGQSARGQ